MIMSSILSVLCNKIGNKEILLILILFSFILSLSLALPTLTFIYWHINRLHSIAITYWTEFIGGGSDAELMLVLGAASAPGPAPAPTLASR